MTKYLNITKTIFNKPASWNGGPLKPTTTQVSVTDPTTQLQQLALDMANMASGEMIHFSIIAEDK